MREVFPDEESLFPEGTFTVTFCFFVLKADVPVSESLRGTKLIPGGL